MRTKFQLLGSILVITLMFNSTLHAQRTRPVNSNILIEYGISPKVLDAALSTTLQEGAFKQIIHASRKIGDTVMRSSFEFIYDPRYKDGIDIRIAYNPDSIGYQKNKELLQLAQEMHSFSRLSKSYLYDESSLKLISYDEDEVVLSFLYDAHKLEPELKFGKKATGKIFIKNRELWKVELSNLKSITYNNRKIEAGNFHSVTFYKRAKNGGGHIVSRYEQHYSYIKKKQKVEIEIIAETFEYKNEDDVKLRWASEDSILLPDPDKLEYLDGTLGWALPITGKKARKLGYSLPRPIGISVFSHFQAQELQFTDLQVGYNDSEKRNINSLFQLNNSSVPQTTQITMVRADVWLLPFLNISGLIGQGTNRIDGQLVLDDELVGLLQRYGWLVGIPRTDIPDYIPLRSDLTSLTYGAGVTLAGGIKSFNLSINYQIVVSEVLEANTTKLANVFNPAIGYLTPWGMNIMIGAQGQFYNTVTSGFINIPGGNRITYDVNFEPIRWNFIAGVYVPISDHFDLSVQSGWGQRRSVTAVFGYRF